MHTKGTIEDIDNELVHSNGRLCYSCLISERINSLLGQQFFQSSISSSLLSDETRESEDNVSLVVFSARFIGLYHYESLK